MFFKAVIHAHRAENTVACKSPKETREKQVLTEYIYYLYLYLY